MGLIPDFGKKKQVTEEEINEYNAPEKYLEKYEHEGEEYSLMYKGPDPNKKNRIVVIEPEIAKSAMIKFLEEQLGQYLNNEFKILNEKIEKQFNGLKEDLNNHIEKKTDKIAEEITSQMVSRKFKESIEEKVNQKIEKLKKLLDED